MIRLNVFIQMSEENREFRVRCQTLFPLDDKED